MKYGTWTFGQVEALLNRIGEDNAMKLLGCTDVTVSFDSTGKQACVMADTTALKVWKTIKLGGVKNGKGFVSEIEKRDCRVGDWAKHMLSQKVFSVAKEETDIDLIVLSVAELGFKDGANYCDTCARAIELGLELCPAEVGPQLRLQYADQPRGEWLVIAMEPIRVSGGGLGVFLVGHDGGGRWLSGRYGRPVDFWRADYRFVFCRK